MPKNQFNGCLTHQSTHKWLTDFYNELFGANTWVVGEQRFQEVVSPPLGVERIVFDMSCDPWVHDAANFHVGQLGKVSVQLLKIQDASVAIGDFHCENLDKTSLIFIPTWLIDQSLRDPLTIAPTPRQHIFGCLNGRLTWYRVLIPYFLKTNFRPDQIRATCQAFQYQRHTNWKYDDIKEQIESQISTVPRLDNQTWFDWQDLEQFWDQLPWAENKYDVLDHNVADPAYSDSYVNIVTETSATSFVSEKTFKPIRAGQFFLIYGGVGTIDWLRHLGFDVFDDIFQGHRYDGQSNNYERLLELLDLIKTVHHYDWQDLYEKNFHRLQANQRRLHSNDLLDDVKKLVKDQIQAKAQNNHPNTV